MVRAGDVRRFGIGGLSERRRGRARRALIFGKKPRTFWKLRETNFLNVSTPSDLHQQRRAGVLLGGGPLLCWRRL